MLGIIETVKDESFGYIRDQSWTRVFFHREDCLDGLPAPGERVEFEIETFDPRGPRARDVRIIAAAVADLVRSCRNCGAEYTIPAALQAWHEAKQLPLSVRCETCRKTRHRW